jgi:hypothetical protein
MGEPSIETLVSSPMHFPNKERSFGAVPILDYLKKQLPSLGLSRHRVTIRNKLWYGPRPASASGTILKCKTNEPI